MRQNKRGCYVAGQFKALKLQQQQHQTNKQTNYKHMVTLLPPDHHLVIAEYYQACKEA